jgi:hypothetical protein
MGFVHEVVRIVAAVQLLLLLHDHPEVAVSAMVVQQMRNCDRDRVLTCLRRMPRATLGIYSK